MARMALETVPSRRQRGNPTKWVWGSVGPSRAASARDSSFARASATAAGSGDRTKNLAEGGSHAEVRGALEERTVAGGDDVRAGVALDGEDALAVRAEDLARKVGVRRDGRGPLAVGCAEHAGNGGVGRGGVREGAADVVDAEAVLIAVGLGSGRQRGRTRGVATLPRARDRLREGGGGGLEGERGGCRLAIARTLLQLLITSGASSAG